MTYILVTGPMGAGKSTFMRSLPRTRGNFVVPDNVPDMMLVGLTTIREEFPDCFTSGGVQERGNYLAAAVGLRFLFIPQWEYLFKGETCNNSRT